MSNARKALWIARLRAQRHKARLCLDQLEADPPDAE